MIRLELQALHDALTRVAVGQPEAVKGLVLGVVARENVWLEGPVGCGKTRLAVALGPSCDARTELADCEADRFELWRRGARIERARRGSSSIAEILVIDDTARSRSDFARLLGRYPRLETAIATGLRPGTGLPQRPAGRAAPLSAAALDGFAVQVHMRGLVLSGQMSSARRLIEQGVGSASVHGIDSDTRRAAQLGAAALEVGADARRALEMVIVRLRELASRDSRALLSDRSFAVAALRLMRAHAWLRGANCVEPGDVRVVDFMLLRRIPEAAASEASNAVSEAAAGAPVAGAGTHAGADGTGAGSETREPVAAPLERALPGTHERSPVAAADAEISALVQALEGRLERGRASRREDPAGMPRTWRTLRGLDEVLEADPAEAWLWASGQIPEPPRVPRRERRDRGGAVAVLRDISASMEGRLGTWAGDVVAALAQLGRRRGLRLGYIEFNHRAERFSHGGRFFHAHYDAIAELGGRRRSLGRTSYQAPLALALEELARTRGRDRHVILLTDGVPVVGDAQVRKERALARRLGARIHTVFLGTGPRPEILDTLTLETGGLGFRARPRAGRGITVEVACTSA